MASMIFKSICDDILAPCGVKVGGYKEEIFESLAGDELERLSCQICYLMVKDPMRCSNKHLFCAACIFAWSMTSAENSDRCPLCRVRGSYNEDMELGSQLNNMAVKCNKCAWKGQLGDYRIHSHGLDEVGVDPKKAGLPPVRSSTGDIVFPDIPHDDNLSASIDTSRRQHQRRYLNMEMELVQGQARLAFLLDLFEEDLQRHRDNLTTLVSLQRRYNAEQFNEVMRLEAELGQITSNLLRLIDNANEDVNTMTSRLRDQRGERTLTSRYPDGRIPDRRELSRLHNSHNDALLESPEPQNPIRRARFFQSSYNSRLPQFDPAADAQSNPTTPATQSSNAITTTPDSTTVSQTDPITDGTGTRPRTRRRERLLTRRANEARNRLQEASTEPTSTPSTVINNTSTNNQISAGGNTYTSPTTPHVRSEDNPYSITYPPNRPGRNSLQPSQPNTVSNNPYNITYPPNRSGQSSPSRRISTIELRRNAFDRSRRSPDSNV